MNAPGEEIEQALHLSAQLDGDLSPFRTTMHINHNVSEKSVHLCKQKNVLQKDGIFQMNTRSQIDKVRANSYLQRSTTPKSRMTLTYHALYLPLDHHEQMVTRHDQA